MAVTYRASGPSEQGVPLLHPGDGLAGDRYQIQRLLGGGRYAQVYLATDRDLEQHAGGDARVAIKILRPDYWRNTEARDRLMQEGDLQRTEVLGSHWNIVPVVRELGHHEMSLSNHNTPAYVPYLVMAYIEGITLFDYLQDKGGRAPREPVLLRIFEQLANALDWIHTRQTPVVHRDLASHNVILRCERHADATMLLPERPDFVQLTDFGLAYPVGEPRITQEGTGRIAANLDYASPQILVEQVPAPQDDIYSLAVLAYEAYTGRLPFPYPRHADLDAFQAFVTTVKTQAPAFEPGDNVPPAVQEVILGGLAKAREDRPGSARALIQALAVATEDGKPAPIRPAVAVALPQIGFESEAVRPMPAAAPISSPQLRPAQPPTQPKGARHRLIRFLVAVAAIVALSALTVRALASVGARLGAAPRDPTALPDETAVIAANTPAPQLPDPPSDADAPLTGAVVPLAELDSGIAYVTTGTSGNRIVISDSGGVTADLAVLPGDDIRDLAWAPDGSALAFVVGDEEAVYIHDGETAWRLSPPGARDRWPSWSPDGTQVALATLSEAGLSQILVQTVDGGARRSIVEGALNCWAPAWSPAGTHLAYVAETKSGANVYVAALTDLSAPPVNVSRSGTATIDRPAWSPDGSWLVYATTDGLYWVSVENPAHPGRRFRLTDSADDRGPAVDFTGQVVLFQRPYGAGGVSLYRVPWRGGTPELAVEGACCVATRR